MQVDYKPFVDRMISRYEGPYGWNKKDPGGPTKYGVTCFDLAEHRGQKMTSMSAWAPIVQAMPLSEAEDIYATKYANAIMFDRLPAGPDCILMDYAVNSGIERAIRVARQLTQVNGNAARADDYLIEAIGKYGAKKFVDDVCAERLRFMHAIRGGSAWAEFGHGWQARVDDLRAYGEHLVAGGTHETASPAPDLSKVATPKAKHVPTTASGKTAGGVIVAGTVAHEAGLPWSGVAAVCAGVLVAGLAYELWQEHQTSAANKLVHA